jgi:hypothetical protein
MTDTQYFYTKTRNYRVFYAAATTGARYALGLGGAVAAYCILDDSAGWLREQLGWAADTHQVVRDTSVPVHDHRRRLSEIRDVEGDRWSGWRQGPVHWEDGAFAGLLMGAGVGFACELTLHTRVQCTHGWLTWSVVKAAAEFRVFGTFYTDV